jgi:small conductance mechanosensitive channel
MEISQETAEAIIRQAIELAYQVIPSILYAILFYLIGRFIIIRVLKGLRNYLNKREESPTLGEFVYSFSKVVFYITLFVGVATIIGIPISSFLAIFGAAGLAIGLALQGSLSNFAGGLLILAFKPFRVGDVIVGQGHMGTISKIQILYTHLITFDNREVIIPNGNLANSDIINMSTQETRRTEITVGVAYGTNIKQAKEIILNILVNDPRVLVEPEPFVALNNFGDSSLDLVIRAWANASDLWPVYFDTMESINIEFEKNNIEIPFPQRVMHQLKQKKLS